MATIITWVHEKTQGEYEIVCHAVRETDCIPVVVYRSMKLNGPIWVRPSSEFFDGRFTQKKVEF